MNRCKLFLDTSRQHFHEDDPYLKVKVRNTRYTKS